MTSYNTIGNYKLIINLLDYPLTYLFTNLNLINIETKS